MEDDIGYMLWLKEHGIQESPDYDTYGAYSAGLKPDGRGHLNDTYKLPNHITFSKESIYARQPGAPAGGRWLGSDKSGWFFYASPTNIKNAGGADKLQDYFKQYEPEARLVLPGMKPPRKK